MQDLTILKKFTVLYVEDDNDTQLIISDILKKYFKEVFSAPNGKIGLELYKEKETDIVLSDIQMPILNGIEMSKEIKKINPYQQIALFTAFNEVEYLKQSVNLGISKYILKPFDEKQFFEALLDMGKILQSDLDKERVEHLLEVQSKVTSIGEMLGNIAHQWRQPLSVITTHASGLKASYDLGETIDEEKITYCVDNVIKQALYLSKTIDDFRDFFVADSKSKEEYNIKEILLKLKNLIQSPFNSNFIQIDEQINDDINITINENILIQAFINILNNSKDALVANIENISDRHIMIKVEKIENNVVFIFKDSGGGINKDIIDKIYEPYFTTKHQSVGTGIGLYMTYQIVTKYLKGTIEVSNVNYIYEDKSLNGTQFVITLPIDSEDLKRSIR